MKTVSAIAVVALAFTAFQAGAKPVPKSVQQPGNKIEKAIIGEWRGVSSTLRTKDFAVQSEFNDAWRFTADSIDITHRDGKAFVCKYQIKPDSSPTQIVVTSLGASVLNGTVRIENDMLIVTSEAGADSLTMTFRRIVGAK